jgi:predicted acetyltransferase
MLSREEAIERAPAWFDAHRRRWPGEVSRPASWWPFIFGEKETWRGGGPQFVVAVDDTDDRPGGYAIYRVTDGPGPDDRKLRVRELVAADPGVQEQLWRYLFGVDLVTVIDADIGLDDPLRWRLTDFRALRVTGEHDFLWARVVDPVAALSARRYARAGELVVELVDDARPEVAGRYSVAGDPDRAHCDRTSAPADLVMDVAELGSLLLGGVSARALGAAGRIEERSAGALGVADGFFGSPTTRPFCSSPF